MLVVELCGPDVAIQAARNFRALRAQGVTIRKTIATRGIESGVTLLYSDRDFDPFVQHFGLRSALLEACPEGHRRRQRGGREVPRLPGATLAGALYILAFKVVRVDAFQLKLTYGGYSYVVVNHELGEVLSRHEDDLRRNNPGVFLSLF